MEYDDVKLEVYVPKAALESVLAALHEAGAGRFEQYDHVCSYYPVTGQWRPLSGANPYSGTVGEMSTETEYKIELRCTKNALPAALAAVHRTHPYEKPVIYILPLLGGQYEEI